MTSWADLIRIVLLAGLVLGGVMVSLWVVLAVLGMIEAPSLQGSRHLTPSSDRSGVPVGMGG